jgi:uracil-DNA glycosylase
LAYGLDLKSGVCGFESHRGYVEGIMEIERLHGIYSQYHVDLTFEHMRASGINFVGGHGPLEPKLMLIGEAPGKMENARLVPFVGAAGKQLSELLRRDVGISIAEVFVTNIVKYWPFEVRENAKGEEYKATRTPTSDEIEASRAYLFKEIDIVKPEIIGLCGRSAAQAVIPEFAKIGLYNGDLIDDKYVPLFHPAMMGHAPHREAEIRRGYMKLGEYMGTRVTRDRDL